MSGWREKQALRLILGASPNGASRFRSNWDITGHRSDESREEDFAERTEGLLATYYDEQANRFPYEKVKAVLSTENPETQASPYSDKLNGVLTEWLQSGREEIEKALSTLLKAATAAALALTVAKYAKELGVVLQPGTDVLARLGRWAQTEAKAFLDRCERALKEGLGRLVSSALQSGGSPAEIAARMKDFLKNWIGRTKQMAADEATLAQEHGYYEANVILGAETKQWFTVGDARVCGECRANEAQGPISVEEPFASGQQYPPAHGLCRCMLQYEGVNRESALQAF